MLNESFLANIIIVFIILLLFLNVRYSFEISGEKTHVLFIIFDDLRPELSIYGKNHMLTPNFERLASKSVIFDRAYCQISVCNPSRDSLLTGLRPDTVGTYNFQWSLGSLLTFPTFLQLSGYKTYSFGKIFHWEEAYRSVWSSSNNADWYSYQNNESASTKHVVYPDETTDEKSFRDYMFTTMAINNLKNIHTENQQFTFTGIGFKLPHLALHVPQKYYHYYDKFQRENGWNLTEFERTFPLTSPNIAYRCCAENEFHFYESTSSKSNQPSILDKSPSNSASDKNDKKTKKSSTKNTNLKPSSNSKDNSKSIPTIQLPNDLRRTFPREVHTELMQGYSAAITYLDTQLGRLLHTIDELELWNNMTIILTSDHGIHNGEKGMWEKWTLFEETTRVPLLIYHPRSPFAGRHYSHPVELVDIFPTLVDLMGLSFTPTHQHPAYLHYQDKKRRHSIPPPFSNTSTSRNNDMLPTTTTTATATTTISFPLQGKSLAPIIFGSLKNTSAYAHHSSAFGDGMSTTTTPNSTTTASAINRLRQRSQTTSHVMPRLSQNFAISQLLRCADIPSGINLLPNLTHHIDVLNRFQWKDCDFGFTTPELVPPLLSTPRSRRPNGGDGDGDGGKSSVVSLMGYSIRTLAYRYTAWFKFNLTTMSLSSWEAPVVLFRELYAHNTQQALSSPSSSNSSSSSNNPTTGTTSTTTVSKIASRRNHINYNAELVNRINEDRYSILAKVLHGKLISFLKRKIIFHGSYFDHDYNITLLLSRKNLTNFVGVRNLKL